jgi:hypothetical protein
VSVCLGFTLLNIPSSFIFDCSDTKVKLNETNFAIRPLSNSTAYRQKHVCFLSMGFCVWVLLRPRTRHLSRAAEGLSCWCVCVNWAVHVINVWWRTLDPFCLTSTVMCRGTVNPLTTAATNFVVAPMWQLSGYKEASRLLYLPGHKIVRVAVVDAMKKRKTSLQNRNVLGFISLRHTLHVLIKTHPSCSH